MAIEPPAAAMRPFPRRTLAALVAAIDVNDLIDPEAIQPASLALDFPAERFIDGFQLSHQLWRERFDPSAVSALAARVRRGEPLDDRERLRLKQVRAAFKHLRFAFVLYDAAHRAPAVLSLITLEMGEVQDAVRVGRTGAARRHAAALQLLLAPPVRRLLHHKSVQLRPTSAAGFRDFTLAQAASLRPLLAAPAIRSRAFHAARKVVSRQVSFHDDMRTLYPDDRRSAEHRAMARWLATLNGMMGRYHDDLVVRHAAGTFRYDRDVFALPKAMRARLEAMAVLYLGSSSSNPSSA